MPEPREKRRLWIAPARLLGCSARENVGSGRPERGPHRRTGFIDGSAYRNRTGSMFGSVKTLFSHLVDGARLHTQFEIKDRLVATAALLIRIATVDKELSEARRRRLHAVLKSYFELDDATTVRLVDDADAANRTAIDLYHFTRQLNNAIDDKGRRQIVKMMWTIIYVDGSVNDLESNIIWRAADLLGVPTRQRVELRREVAADRAALT
jgi:uncharacterized tellurite resistance protein B-like protein